MSVEFQQVASLNRGSHAFRYQLYFVRLTCEGYVQTLKCLNRFFASYLRDGLIDDDNLTGVPGKPLRKFNSMVRKLGWLEIED